MKRPKIRNLIQNDGLTQPNRFLPELDPQFARIDDRDLNDLLALTWKFSDHLHFYEAVETGAGEEVRENGSWQELLRYDQLFYLALISHSSPVKYSKEFEAALLKLSPENGSIQPGEEEIFAAFVVVVSCCEEVDAWFAGLPAGSKGSRDLKIYIGQLTNKVEQLLALYNHVKKDDDTLWLYVADKLKTWAIDRPDSNGSEQPMGKEETAGALRNLFVEVQTIYAAIVNQVKQTIEASLQENSHQGHVGLFLAFLRLLEYSREHLNTLTGRHLDFYFRKILQLKPRQRKPDSVNLTFETAKKVERHLLAKGTALKGGKNSEKIERLYDLKDELALSRARVAGLKNIHVKTAGNATPVRTVYAGIKADSLDGLGKALPAENPKWPGFGSDVLPLAELGFAIASPLFRLSEGERKVTMTFSLANLEPLMAAYANEFAAVADEEEIPLPDLFAARVTTAKGWYDCTPKVSVDKKKTGLILAFVFDMDVPAIVDYDAEKLADPIPFPCKPPVFRITVNQQDHPEAYDALSRLRADQVLFRVDVDKIREVVLANDSATLKPDKPFLPFSGQPRIDSSFLIGHAESFSKPLTELSLSWSWVDPPKNLETHYQNYTDEQFQFTADVDLRENYGWQHSLGKNVALSILADPISYGKIASLPTEKLLAIQQTIQAMSPSELTKLQEGTGSIPFPAKIELTDDAQKALQQRFILGWKNIRLNLGRSGKGLAPATDGKDGKTVAGSDASAESAAVTDKKDTPQPQFVSSFTFAVSGYDAVSESELFSRFSETLRQGGIRFRLKTPEFAFGHKLYPKLHSQAVAAALRSDNPDPSLLDTLQIPYTPMFESLELSYVAEKTFSLSAREAELDMLLLTPFGYSGLTENRLVVDCQSEGSLYIGLADLTPPQNLSLLIQLAEGSGDPFKTAPGDVSWGYLTDTGWIQFPQAEILRDGTLGFLQSGIIEFSLPDKMSAVQPEMPAGMHWLRVTASDNTTALNDVLAITAQAGVAVYRDEGHRAEHLATALPAGSITKMLVRDTKIKSINQPFASYGGREAENDREFRTRVAERLRHKGRAVGLWDYEHLILDRFPEIHKVKCLNHACPGSEYSPGNVMLVLIPDLRNRNSRYPLRPAVPQSLLQEVKQYIVERCSAHVDIHVVNPFYERISVGGMAHFLPGFDQGIYQMQLRRDITNGLTPWLRGEKDIHFGNRIHGSVILNLIEELAYVDYLSSFTLTHYSGPDDTEGKQVDEVIATSNRSILVSHDTHTIQGVSAQ